MCDLANKNYLYYYYVTLKVHTNVFDLLFFPIFFGIKLHEIALSFDVLAIAVRMLTEVAPTLLSSYFSLI